MFQVREERVERAMNEHGFDRMAAVNHVRCVDAVQENYRRGKHPSWFVPRSYEG